MSYVAGRKMAWLIIIRYLSLGPVFGPILCCIIAVEHYFFWFLEWWYPREEIDYVDHQWDHDAFVTVWRLR